VPKLMVPLYYFKFSMIVCWAFHPREFFAVTESKQ